jgi:hypothetical protein
MVRPRLLPAIAALVLLVAACSQGGPAEPTPPSASSPTPIPVGSAPSVIPQFITPEIATGEQRFLFSIIDPTTNTPIAAPDREVMVRFLPADGPAIDAGRATFIWAIEDERGIYVVDIDLPTAGEWTAEFRTPGLRGGEERIRASFPVTEEPSAVRVGEAAPSVDTPTIDVVGGDLARIATDAEPLPALYQTSVADALEHGDPFVLAFATPKFCQTAQCGPTLDRLKPFVERYPSVTFINVEPYKLVFDQDQLQPELDADGQLQVVDAVTAYGILAEPWVYVVDGEGIVRGSFELIFSDAELEAVLDTVS